ncbi:hypothetical protein SERLADRAFT_436157 [Serpula lacrymans var. lacrymans S7.9]|uniref:tripeptidyl-peptidase II n=1 Tax=Serpula lacrymans var. lacrymans (strain S7.9) TaxID=578457 RepID=F8NRY4_SERL9|nr:uncharacterized protein SERLADRAFT_436157 [Serpula lacrymans var. lacrymans S7.9]EGO26346.1 hypothetical protein SERLADRAFT_436157 [Serpula lacrymans var. lacrymans S7.9]
MRSLILPLVSLALVVVSFANPLVSPHVLHEKRSSTPYGWSRVRKLNSTAVIPLRFAIAQNHIENIGEYLYDISLPGSPNYGNHWTASEIAAKFAPSHDSIQAIRSWLMQSGLEPERIKLSSTKGWITIEATTEEAEDLLQADYHVFKHDTGKEHVACESYHLPAHITPHVDFVTPTIHFDSKLSKRSAPASDSTRIGLPGNGNGPKTTGSVDTLLGLGGELKDCDKQITLSCLRALYGLVYAPLATSENSFGIVEYTPEAYLQSDTDLFANAYTDAVDGVDLPKLTPDIVFIDGGIIQTVYKGFEYNGEANLDMQYGIALVTPAQRVTMYQTGDMIIEASFNNFLDAIDGSYCTFEGGDDPSEDSIYPDTTPGGYEKPQDCGTVKPANVISTSYGYNEADLSPSYVARQCAEYAKLGLMGVTILYSSGDYGVAGNGATCLNRDGTQTKDGKIFNPTFPSTCPFVTSIGATQVNPGSSVFDPESACEQVIYSSGGFSNYFAMPHYQKDAVENYLKNHSPPYSASIWNSTGTSRAFPDLSANGANYVVAIDGNFSLVYGTSASTPVVGAILTMVNDARIAAGKSTIGFINPAIYSSDFSDAFNDITTGSNPGCGTPGFTSAPGWDPVTGLGTPNFFKLLERWLDLGDLALS